MGAIDNLDHNPTSSLYKEAFHGTAMSIFQMRSKDSPGNPREKL